MKRIVIIGAGFAGPAAAKALKHADADVVVIDRANHNLFQPSFGHSDIRKFTFNGTHDVSSFGLASIRIRQRTKPLLHGDCLNLGDAIASQALHKPVSF